MQVVDIDQDSPKWLEFRRGKITGSKLNDIVVKRGTAKKDGFYELIAERLSLDELTDELPMDRGHRLEVEAVEQLEEVLGYTFNKKPGMWISDIDENIAISPDGGRKVGKHYKEAVEVKCLAGKHHLRAIEENKIPDKYWLQVVQYFVVNERLEVLHFVFYDPRVMARPLHVIKVERETIADEIQYYIDYEISLLKEVDECVERLAF